MIKVQAARPHGSADSKSGLERKLSRPQASPARRRPTTHRGAPFERPAHDDRREDVPWPQTQAKAEKGGGARCAATTPMSHTTARGPLGSTGSPAQVGAPLSRSSPAEDRIPSTPLRSHSASPHQCGCLSHPFSFSPAPLDRAPQRGSRLSDIPRDHSLPVPQKPSPPQRHSPQQNRASPEADSLCEQITARCQILAARDPSCCPARAQAWLHMGISDLRTTNAARALHIITANKHKPGQESPRKTRRLAPPPAHPLSPALLAVALLLLKRSTISV